MQKYFYMLLLSFMALSSHAHTAGAGKSLSFIQNQGQWVSEVQYKAVLPGGSLFLTPQGFVYNFYSVEDVMRLHDLRQKGKKDISRERVRTHAYKVNFEGANKHAEVMAEEKRAFYHNYFLGKDASKWKGGVPLFGKLTYRSLYPGIDLVIYNTEKELKYDFVLAKGADATDILLSFDGVSPTLTAKGELKLKTSVGDMIESAPYTYQLIDGKKITIPSAYKKIGVNKIGFSLGAYNKDYPLIIDPSLVFATYSGSTSMTFGFCATYNNQGDLIDAGESFGTGWPVKTGAFQMNFAGGVDIGIDRFSANGSTLLHATYLGGAGSDQPVSLICDNNMDLYVMSITESTDFPVTLNGYDNTHNGQLDYAVTHLNNTFTGLIGSTYIGGTQNDGAYNPKGEIYLDAMNNIYIGGYSQSSDYPVTTGAVQTVAGGATDGVVSMLNNSCANLMASTFLGGANDDMITGIRKMPNGNIAVAGTSESQNYPTTAGVFQTTANGPNLDNGIVTVLSPTLTGTVASTYVHAPGATSTTSIQFVDFDKQNNLYVYGATDTTFPISAGKYANANGRTLLAKFPPTLDSLMWATRIGASSGTATAAISPTAFLADNCGKIYLAGYGWGMNVYPITPNAISSSPDGFWIAVLDTNAANLIFGTFFGSSGDHLDGGTSRFDKKGIIYHAVCCGNNNFPTTPTAAYPNRVGTAGYDIVGYKLDVESAAVVAMNAASPGLTSCTLPFTVSFTNYSQNAVTYYWDFGDGTTDTASNPTHTFTTAGLYNVMFVAANPTTCNLFDTTYLQIQVLDSAFEVADIDTTICFQNGFEPVQLTAQAPTAGSNALYQWLPNPAIISGSNTPTVTIDPSIDTVFQVVVTDSIYGACSISDTGLVVIHAIEVGNYYALPDTTILFCPGEEFQLFATGNGTNQYSWIDLSGLNTLRDSTSAAPYIKPINEYSSYVVHIYDATRTCSITDTVNAQQRPVIDVTAVSPYYICIDDTLLLSAATSFSSGTYTIVWKDISGGEPIDMLSGHNTLTPVVAPRESREYIVELNPEDPEFCNNADTVSVHLHPLPGLEAGPDETIRYGDAIQLNAAGNGSFLWYPADYLSNTTVNNPISNTPETIKYYVEVVTAEGCRANDSITVRVTQLSFPTAFTPNGDGRNDKLKLIISNPFVELEKWIIVDKWGKEVLNTTDVNDAWDGTYDGTYAEIGVYFYYLKYRIGRNTYTEKGDVTLVR